MWIFRDFFKKIFLGSGGLAFQCFNRSVTEIKTVGINRAVSLSRRKSKRKKSISTRFPNITAAQKPIKITAL